MENEQQKGMKDYLDEINESFVKIHKGDIIKGNIISVNDTEIMVNIGYHADGIIPITEYSFEKEVNLPEEVQPGQEVVVMVMNIDDGEGNVLLSKRRADQIVVWDELQSLLEEKETFTVKIQEEVKGGVTTKIKGVRAFIPASQLSIDYIKDLSVYVGKEIPVRVIEVEQKDRRVILSGKIVEEEERDKKRKELLGSIEKGQRLKGIVKRLTNFGAFVDIGGIDGLIRNQDLSWKRVKHPSEVVKENDEVEVSVLNINAKEQKIGLSLKDIQQDPWTTVTKKFKVNDVVKGKVIRLMDFGAFVEISDGIEGLVHISEIADKRIGTPSEVLTPGDEVKVKILDIKQKEKRISLSIKEAQEEEHKREIEEYKDEGKGFATMGDLLKGKFDDLDLSDE